MLLLIFFAACSKKKDEPTTIEEKSKLNLLTSGKWQLTRFTHQEYDGDSIMTEDIDYIDSFSVCEKSILYSFNNDGVFDIGFDPKVCDSLAEYDFILPYGNWAFKSDSTKIDFDSSPSEDQYWMIEELTDQKLTIRQDHYGGILLFRSIRSFKKVK